MSRLFISLEIPDDILDKLIQIRSEVYGNGEPRKWEKKNKLHLTLKFLGDTDLEKEINNKLESLLRNQPELNCSLDKFGMFYRKSIPSILWASFKENRDLMNLQEKIENSMYQLGFEKDKRKFKPHITLLRNKSNQDLHILERFKKYDLSYLQFRIKNVKLVQSKLKSSGSEYYTIKKFELNKQED